MMKYASTKSAPSLFKAPMVKVHRGGLATQTRDLKTMGAATGIAPVPKGVVHNGQPKALPGSGLKTGHTATNTGSNKGY